MAVNPFHPTGVGIPGGVGGGVLGLGVVLALHDQFSKQANLAKAQLAGLSAATDKYTMRMNKNLLQLQASLAGLAVGMATMAAFSFPIRSAIRFEEAIQRVRVVAGDTDRHGNPLPLARLESMAINLAAIFPQDATEMANALRITIAAGIDDVDKADALLRSTNKLAVATQSNLQQVIQGMTSFVNAYQLGLNDVYSPEIAQTMYDELGSALLETIKHGKFSASGDITDVEQMSKFFGQIAPTASALNIDIPELLALWATATLGGQDARRSATGLRQAFMDLNNRARALGDWKDFREFADTRTDYDLSGGDLTGFVQAFGFMDLLDLVSDYAGFRPEDADKVQRLLESDRMQRNMDVIMNELPEDMSIDEAMKSSEHFQELVEGLRQVGGLDITRINEIFRSIWGLTAVLPLVGVQRDRMRRTDAHIRRAMWENELQRGFEAIMNTVNKQWELFTSKMETVRILWGRTMLAPIRDFLKFLNLIVDVVINLSQRFEFLAGVIMQIGVGVGMFMSTFFGLLTLSKGINMLNLGFRQWLKQLKWFPRYVRLGLLGMFRDIIAIMAVLITTITILRKAWDEDFMGMSTAFTSFWRRLTVGTNAIIKAFQRFDDTGQAFLTMEEYNELLEVGLHPTVIGRTFAFLFRVREALFGIRDGFLEFFQGIRGFFEGLERTVFRPLWFIFNRIDEFLQTLWAPTRANIEAWRAWGERIGFVLAILTTAIASLLLINNLVRSSLAILHLMPVSMAAVVTALFKPFTLALVAVGGALYGLYRLIGPERLREFWEELIGPGGAQRLDQLRYMFSRLPIVFSEFGWEGLSYTLASMFETAFGATVAEFWSNITNRLARTRFLLGNVDYFGLEHALKRSFEVLTGVSWDTVYTYLLTQLRRLRDYVVSVLGEELVEGVTSSLTGAWNAVSAFFRGIVDTMAKLGVKDALMSLVNIFINIGTAIAQFAKGFWESAGPSLTALAYSLGETLVLFVRALEVMTSSDALVEWRTLGGHLGHLFGMLAAAVDFVLIPFKALLTLIGRGEDTSFLQTLADGFSALWEGLSRWFGGHEGIGVLGKFWASLMGLLATKLVAIVIFKKLFGVMVLLATAYGHLMAPMVLARRVLATFIFKTVPQAIAALKTLWLWIGPKLFMAVTYLRAAGLVLTKVFGALAKALVTSLFRTLFMLNVLVFNKAAWAKFAADWVAFGKLIAGLGKAAVLGVLKLLGTFFAFLYHHAFMFATKAIPVLISGFAALGRAAVVFLAKIGPIGWVLAMLGMAYATNLGGFRDWVNGVIQAFRDDGIRGAVQFVYDTVTNGLNRLKTWFDDTPLGRWFEGWWSTMSDMYDDLLARMAGFVVDAANILNNLPFVEIDVDTETAQRALEAGVQQLTGRNLHLTPDQFAELAGVAEPEPSSALERFDDSGEYFRALSNLTRRTLFQDKVDAFTEDGRITQDEWYRLVAAIEQLAGRPVDISIAGRAILHALQRENVTFEYSGGLLSTGGGGR